MTQVLWRLLLHCGSNISQNYYIIGGTKDWTADAAKTQKFNHSDINVYDDPIFTITIPAKEGDDTWFGIVDDKACEGVAAGDWSSVLAPVKGNGNNAMNETEKLDTRARLATIHHSRFLKVLVPSTSRLRSICWNTPTRLLLSHSMNTSMRLAVILVGRQQMLSMVEMVMASIRDSIT